MDKVDVVIVGGGMAGLSTATTLCEESDLSVILVEESSVGSNQGIRAVFLEPVNEFGLRDSVVQLYDSFVWHSSLGAMAKFDYEKVEVAGVDYRKACEILYERAVRNGLVWLRAKAVRWSPEIPSPTNPLVIHLDTGDSVQAEILIDASGSAQWAAKQLGTRRSTYYSICYGELLTGCSGVDPSTFCFLMPNSRYGNGGGWFYPSGKDSVSIGYSIVVPEKRSPIEDLMEGYFRAKEDFRPYADWVKRGSRERIEAGVVPVGRIARFVSDRILIVGDAAGQAHPWSVEGCRPSLVNGRICARVVLEACRKRNFDRLTLGEYERRWSEFNRERFWRASSVAEVVWKRSAQDWDRFVALAQRLSPDQQLKMLRDNEASLFQKIYAVMGYARRQLVKWVRRQVGPAGVEA
jgi:digeranylgeranylglycerophospholipid reductase